jgi:hypothetical protein
MLVRIREGPAELVVKPIDDISGVSDIHTIPKGKVIPGKS